MPVSQPHVSHCGVGTACHGCGRRLPLRLADTDEDAVLWECVECQTPFAGMLSPDVLRMLARRIRLSALHFDVEQAEPLNDAALQVVWRHAVFAQRDIFRDGRRSRRVSGHREVAVLSLDERYRLAGPAINGIVANLSRHGQMLVTPTQLVTPVIITQFQNASGTIQLVGRVVWSRYLDLGYYGAGIDFLARLGGYRFR